MADPTFHVSEDDKIALIRALMPQLFDALQAASGPEGFTGDHVIDVFALGMGLIIDNDTNLTAPSHFREAAESVKHHITRRLKDLRAARGDGPSAQLDPGSAQADHELITSRLPSGTLSSNHTYRIQ